MDDGSPDNYGKICDDYAAKDNRVKVIHQQNVGVSVARQTGIDNASGEYSIHADPDDWVEPNMIEELVAKAKVDDADMVICDFYRESKSGTTYDSQNPGDDLSANAVLRKILYQQLHGSCCNKLVKRNCIEGIGFIPEDLCILEDELYIIRILVRNIKVSYLPMAFYHYRIDNEQSLCNTPSDKSFKSKVKAIESIESFCIKNVSELTIEDFIPLKSIVLHEALRTKQYSHLTNLSSDFKSLFIKNGTPYSINRPGPSCVALALKGYPVCAHIFYYWNWKFLACIHIIKKTGRHIHRNSI